MPNKARDRFGIDPEHPNLKARVLPHNNEAEQAVLGCVLLDADAPIHILSELTAADFYSKSHGHIFDAMVQISRRDEPVDVVTLTQQLDTMGLLESVGGLTYLADLTNCVPGAANYKHYVGLVKKLSGLRKLIGVAQKITDVAFVGDPEDDALGYAEREIYALGEESERSALREIQPSVVEAISRMEEMYRDPTAGKGIPVYVSLEERMGCGIGACLVCVCDKTDGAHARVCKDGPVFEIGEVRL